MEKSKKRNTVKGLSLVSGGIAVGILMSLYGTQNDIDIDIIKQNELFKKFIREEFISSDVKDEKVDIVYRDKIIYKDKIVPKIEYRDKIVTQIVEKPFEVIKEVIIEKPIIVEKEVVVEKQSVVDNEVVDKKPLVVENVKPIVVDKEVVKEPVIEQPVVEPTNPVIEQPVVEPTQPEQPIVETTQPNPLPTSPQQPIVVDNTNLFAHSSVDVIGKIVDGEPSKIHLRGFLILNDGFNINDINLDVVKEKLSIKYNDINSNENYLNNNNSVLTLAVDGNDMIEYEIISNEIVNNYYEENKNETDEKIHSINFAVIYDNNIIREHDFVNPIYSVKVRDVRVNKIDTINYKIEIDLNLNDLIKKHPKLNYKVSLLIDDKDAIAPPKPFTIKNDLIGIDGNVTLTFDYVDNGGNNVRVNIPEAIYDSIFYLAEPIPPNSNYINLFRMTDYNGNVLSNGFNGELHYYAPTITKDELLSQLNFKYVTYNQFGEKQETMVDAPYISITEDYLGIKGYYRIVFDGTMLGYEYVDNTENVIKRFLELIVYKNTELITTKVLEEKSEFTDTFVPKIEYVNTILGTNIAHGDGSTGVITVDGLSKYNQYYYNENTVTNSQGNTYIVVFDKNGLLGENEFGWLMYDKNIYDFEISINFNRIFIKPIFSTEPTVAPTEPTPSEPTPSEPTPSEPTPSEPTPSEPTPSEPTPSEPTPSEPTPSEPTPSEPTPSEPTPSEPTPSEPTPSEPTPSEPTPSEPITP